MPKRNPLGCASAPSAQQFFEAAGKSRNSLDHGQYMDFAERYADFVVEFEKQGGNLGMCEHWPLSRVGRMVDY